MKLPTEVKTKKAGGLKDGGRYNLTLWHGDPEVMAPDELGQSVQVFPPRVIEGGTVRIFEVENLRYEDGIAVGRDKEVRYEVAGLDKTAATPDEEVTIGFLPEHVLTAEEV